jgi:hypothetical protein
MRDGALEAWRDFRLLTAVATHLARCAEQTCVGKGRRSIGLTLFEYVCSMADGIIRIVSECWFDVEARAAVRSFPPLAVLTRSLLDGYAQFHFLAAEDVSEDERSFRYCICNIYDRCRESQIGEGYVQELESMTSERGQDDGAPVAWPAAAKKAEEQAEQFRGELFSSSFYQRVLCPECQRFWKSRWKRGYEMCRRAIWKRAGIRELARRSGWFHLSSYVHAGPVAIHELAQAQPGVHLQYVPHWAGCVGLAIKRFLSLFPEREQALAPDEHEIIRQCSHWVQWVSDTAGTADSGHGPRDVGCTACWMRAQPA